MASPGEIDRTHCGECNEELPLMVLSSAAGHYIGTFCDKDGPNSRESGYFRTEEEAQDALQQWHIGNFVSKRDTDYHPGGMKVLAIDPDSTTRSMNVIVDSGSGEPSEILTSQRVDQLMEACLFPEGSTRVEGEAIVAAGVIHSYLFQAEAIEQHQEEIHAMLLELPEEFRQDTEHGGWSFLNMCVTKDGYQWTGLHLQQEKLMALGYAAGWLDIPLSKSYWMVLPGGVPYVVVREQRKPRPLLTDEEMDAMNAKLAEQESEGIFHD
jgi:hypothetical protein